MSTQVTATFDSICAEFGFEPFTVQRSWSKLFRNDTTTEVVNARGSAWVLYHPEDDVIAEGEGPDSLNEFFKNRVTQ